MPETKTILLMLLGLAVALSALIWAIGRIINGLRAKSFIERADELHSLAFTAETEEARREAREDFERLVDTAVASTNKYINNRDSAETLKGFAEFTVLMSVEGKASDAGEARAWGERVTEKVQPMLYKGRIS
jgi:hypothetical protein